MCLYFLPINPISCYCNLAITFYSHCCDLAFLCWFVWILLKRFHWWKFLFVKFLQAFFDTLFTVMRLVGFGSVVSSPAGSWVEPPLLKNFYDIRFKSWTLKKYCRRCSSWQAINLNRQEKFIFVFAPVHCLSATEPGCGPNAPPVATWLRVIIFSI